MVGGVAGAIPTGTPDASIVEGVVGAAGAFAYPMCKEENLTWDWDPPKDADGDGEIAFWEDRDYWKIST